MNCRILIALLVFTTFSHDVFCQVETIAGGGNNDGIIATEANLEMPTAIAVDNDGNLYIAVKNRVRKVDASTKIISTVAGTVWSGFGGDGGPATNALLGSRILGLAVDDHGNLYISDANNYRIRKVDAATKTISTIAGNGQGYHFTEGNATETAIAAGGLTLVDDSLYIAGFESIRVLNLLTNKITSIAGDRLKQGLEGKLAIEARLDYVQSVAVDDLGNIFFTNDLSGYQVWKIDHQTKVINRFAGGAYGFGGDGGPALSASFFDATNVTTDSVGNLYICDSHNYRIRRVDATTKTVTTIAGIGLNENSGDNDLATAASIHFPQQVVVDSKGNVFILTHTTVRRIDAETNIITTVAGNEECCRSGDGGLATEAEVKPSALARDSKGNLYVSDVVNEIVRKIDADGIITTVAGGGVSDGPLGIDARLYRPENLAVDNDDNLFITTSFAIYKLYSKTNRISKVVAFDHPTGLAFDSEGRLYVSGDYRVVRIDTLTKEMTTVAGAGTFFPEGNEGMLATSYAISPLNITIDNYNNLYISDKFSHILKVALATNLLSVLTGYGSSPYWNSGSGYEGDGGPASAAKISSASHLVLDNNNNLYFSDTYNNVIRRIDSKHNIISTIAGYPDIGYVYTPDGFAPLETSIPRPSGLVMENDSVLIFADSWNSLVRRTDFIVPKANQFLVQSLDITLLNDADTSVIVRSSSGLKLALEKVSGDVTIHGDTVVIHSAGPVTLIASNAGNDEFNSADITLTFCVNPVIPVIHVENNSATILVSSSPSHNQWVMNGEEITGAVEQFLEITESGSYSVAVSVFGCRSVSESTNFIVAAVSEDLNGSLEVYPNPANALLHINSHVLPLGAITIFDLAGKQLLQTNCSGEPKCLVNLDQLPIGLFVLVIQTRNGKIARTIYKQ